MVLVVVYYLDGFNKYKNIWDTFSATNGRDQSIKFMKLGSKNGC